MKKQMTRILSIMMTIVMIFTMLPLTVFAEETKVQIVNAYELATKSKMTIGDGYTLNADDYWCIIHTSDSTRAVYCIEPGKHVLSGDMYNENAAENYLNKVKNKTLSTEEIQTALRRTFLYAYTGKLDTAESYMKYTATQLLVWEVIVGQRDLDFKRVSNGYTLVEKMLSNFKDDYAGQKVSEYYYDYEAKIQKDKKSVSFAKVSKESAKASAVKAGADGTYTFTDKNKQLENFDASISNGTVVSKSGNSLKVKADDGKTAVVTLTQNNLSDSGEFTGFLTLTSNSKQTLAKLKAGKRKYYVAVKGLENGNLEIIKTSEDGIVANIEFTVTGNGKTYNVKTDSNGKIKVPNLTAGEYTVTEKVPARYESQQSKKVTVQAGKTAAVSFSNTLKTGAIKINKQSEDGEVGNRTFAIDGQEEVITVEKCNTAQKGKISVRKTGDIFARVQRTSSAYTDEDGNLIENPTTYTPVFEIGNLAGAVFQVIASEDIITADGTVRVNAGDVVAEITTDENGYAATDLLYLGKYEVKEIKAPEGYVLNSESQFVELVYAGQEIEVRDTVNAAFVNDYQRVEISLEKILEQDETFGIGKNEEYKNVRFGLFAEEEITAADGTEILANGLISEISLDENMKAVFSVKLPFAKYYVREITADEHYILGDEKYSFDFKYSEEAETVIIDCGEFENRLKRGTVKGLKLDENNEPLENAVFGLFKPDCTEFTEENALMTAKSDDKGCFSFADIPFGEFAVREIKAPTGYILSDKLYQVNITEDGQVIEITAENKPITVEFSKRDTEGNELKGAKLQIVDEKGNVIEEWTSDGTNHIVKKLKAGKYVLTETAAPDGYEIATDISFEVFEDGTVKAGNIETVAVSKDGNPLIVMVDEAEEKQITPQTGDNRSKLPGILLTGTGLSILVILILKSKKKNGGKDEK